MLHVPNINPLSPTFSHSITLSASLPLSALRPAAPFQEGDGFSSSTDVAAYSRPSGHLF